MGYALLVIAGLVAGIAGFFVWSRYRRARDAAAATALERRATAVANLTPDAQIAKLRQTGKYWGYRIESHCHASSRLAGRQYSFDDTPPLPVPGCEARVCSCCMVGMPERRQQRERRSGQDRRRTIRMDSTDRRSDRPRRKGDLSWASYSHL